MADDLMKQFQGLMDNPDIGAQLESLMPDGFDPSKLLDILKGNPDLLAKVRELLPDIDIEGALTGLAGAVTGAVAGTADAAGDAAAGAAGAAADAAGAATDTAGGILDKVKDLFGRLRPPRHRHRAEPPGASGRRRRRSELAGALFACDEPTRPRRSDSQLWRTNTRMGSSSRPAGAGIGSERAEPGRW